MGTISKVLATVAALLTGTVAANAQTNVTIGTYKGLGPAGWSTFTPTPVTTGTCAAGTANGTCTIYVANDGSGGCAMTNVGDTSQRCNNLPAALALLNSHNNNPHWLLIRKGDSFSNSILSGDGLNCCFGFNGRDINNIMVIGAYDPATPSVVNPATGGARPIINYTNTQDYLAQAIGGVATSGGQYIAIVGLDFYAPNGDITVTGRPTWNTGGGLLILNPFNWELWEDNRFRYLGNGLLPEPYPVSGNLYVRRNVFAYSWGQGAEGGSTGAHVPFYFDENIVHHNGFLTVTPTVTVTAGSPLQINSNTGFNSTLGGTQVTFGSAGGNIAINTPYYVYRTATPYNFSSFYISLTAPIVGTGTTASGSSTLTNISTNGILVNGGVFATGPAVLAGTNINATQGARYMAATGQICTVTSTVSGASSVIMSTCNIELFASSGTLTKISGTGDATIPYTSTARVVPAGTTVSSIPSNFNITANTHTTTTIDGITSTAGIFVGANVSSSDAACASSQPTIAAGTVVTAVFANSLTISPAACATVSGLTPIQVIPNALVMSAAATTSYTGANITTTPDTTHMINSVGGEISPQTMTWSPIIASNQIPPNVGNNNPCNCGFVHNMYWPTWVVAQVPPGDFYTRGNFLSYETAGTQIRPGGFFQENAMLAYGGGMVWATLPGLTTQIHDNVDSDSQSFGFGSQSFQMPSTPSYQGDPLNTSPSLLFRNLTVNSTIGGGANSEISLGAGFTVTYSNNIMWNFSTNSGTQFGTVPQKGMGSGHVSNGGSGYFDRSAAITAVNTDTQTGFALLTYSPSSPPPPSTADNIWITGLTDTGGTCVLNNAHWKMNIQNTGIAIVNSPPTHCSGTGTMWLGGYPYTFSGTTHSNTTIDGIASTAGMYVGNIISDQCGGCLFGVSSITAVNSGTSITINNAAASSTTANFTNVPVVSLTTSGCVGCSSSGAGATAVYISVSGVIKYINLNGSDQASGSAIEPQPGTNYNVGDVLTINGGGGSGTARYTVDSVGVMTDGGGNTYQGGTANPNNYPGCAGGPPQNCTAGKYYQSVLVSACGWPAGSTVDAYAAQMINMSKVNWCDAAMPATGFVPWMQAGFGLAAGAGGVWGSFMGHR